MTRENILHEVFVMTSITRIKAHELVEIDAKEGLYELFMGPQHMATENFGIVLRIKGNVVERAAPDPGFLHRGFEKGAEFRNWINNVAFILRLCVPEPDVNEAAYSMAVESLAGWEPPLRAQYIRTLVLEMARYSAFLFWTGTMANEIGLYTAGQWAIADRERILWLFEELTGVRVYHIYIFPGGVRRDIPDGWIEKLKRTVKYLKERLKDYDRLFFENKITIDRLEGLGKISRKDAIGWGVTGPNLRATGAKIDVRSYDPYLVYEDLNFEPQTANEGDALARMIVRRLEMAHSLELIEEIIEKMPSGEVQCPELKRAFKASFATKIPEGDSFAHVESSKGDFGYYIVSATGNKGLHNSSKIGSSKPYRLHVRGPSFTHAFHVLPKLLKGVKIADVPVIYKSLDICPPDADR